MVVPATAARRLITWLSVFILECCAVLGAPHHADAQVNSCAGILADSQSAERHRQITPIDLLRLRDIGFDTGYASESPLALSPDHSSVAFVITRADPSTNKYCQALVTFSLASRKPRVIDVGGEYIPAVSYIRGNRTINGSPSVISPKWSPDGRWVAYLKRTDGVNRVWRISVDGSERHAVTTIDADGARVGWSDDGGRVLFASRDGLAKLETAIDIEGRRGFLYDARIFPPNGFRPAISAGAAMVYRSIDLATNAIGKASDRERRTLGDPTRLPVPVSTGLVSAGSDGSVLWTEARDPSRLMSTSDLWFKRADQAAVRCPSPSCQSKKNQIQEILWADGAALFLRREGWANSETALYRWTPGKLPARVYSTSDLLSGCISADKFVICTQEGSKRPRVIIQINPRSGHAAVLYDPNPDFHGFNLGEVERIYWRNEYGLPAYGDLVLPPNFRRGHKVPLVIVQYITRGFLRGGIGDEYPIFLFASHGLAVLSVQAPQAFYESLPDAGWRTWQEAEIESTREWRERWSTLSSILKGIEIVEEKGIIDSRKIGLTGLSDGATSAQFALINAQYRFAAASISTCCMEPASTRIDGGLAFYDLLTKVGYPRISESDANFWRPMSLSANAGNMRTPLLMQVAEHEALLSLEAVSHLKDRDAPVEMYVFPNEYHIKSQPAHRLAIYERNLDWFDFWLRGVTNAYSPPEQYKRWQAMHATDPSLQH